MWPAQRAQRLRLVTDGWDAAVILRFLDVISDTDGTAECGPASQADDLLVG